MTSRFTELAVDCREPGPQARFWADVLGYSMGETGDGYAQIVDPEGSLPTLFFVAVPENKTVKNRLHIDVSPRDRDQDAEVARILALGATRADVGQGEDASWVVLADPEGNEFCVLRTQRP